MIPAVSRAITVSGVTAVDSTAAGGGSVSPPGAAPDRSRSHAIVTGNTAQSTSTTRLFRTHGE